MAEVKKRFLFVDDEERILQGIRRALRPMHDEWEMEFITDASQALDLVHRAPPHVVVSDLRMPGMGGTEFLRRLQKYYPSCVRIVLSGHADRDDVMGLTGCVHQFLSKPISTKLLRRVLSRASRMSALL
ncbi:MAG: response regulator, partial [Candidatus Sumerlaeota bacterium]